MQSQFEIPLNRKRHKRKICHQIIMTSNEVGTLAKPYGVSQDFIWGIVVVLCVIIGVLIGYFYHEQQVITSYQTKVSGLNETIAGMEEDKKGLEAEITTLSNRVTILSNTVTMKIASEQELTEVIEAQAVPNEFPLTGSASIEEVTEGEPMCIFTGAVATTVIATASGTVTKIEQDEEYGWKLTIDHGNGYCSIYRNKGGSMVREGDEVVKGTTLFIITRDNLKLGYQITEDGKYLNPMDLLAIEG